MDVIRPKRQIGTTLKHSRSPKQDFSRLGTAQGQQIVPFSQANFNPRRIHTEQGPTIDSASSQIRRVAQQFGLSLSPSAKSKQTKSSKFNQTTAFDSSKSKGKGQMHRNFSTKLLGADKNDSLKRNERNIQTILRTGSGPLKIEEKELRLDNTAKKMVAGPEIRARFEKGTNQLQPFQIDQTESKLEKKKKPLKREVQNTYLKNRQKTQTGNMLPKRRQHQILRTQLSFDSTPSNEMEQKEPFGDLELLGVLGQGTFGQVSLGVLKNNGQQVAVKRVLQDPRYKNREVEIVQMLHSDYVVRTLGTFVTRRQGKQYLNIVMEHYEGDLFNFVKSCGKHGIPPLQFKLIAYQVLRGLLYIHSLGVCHRDVKPQNILLRGMRAVLCDFGSAKILRPDESNLPYICSRCYRAPELIFGATHYNSKVDLWSAGCVFIEMLYSIPLFIGQNSADHLVEVIKVLGTPSKRDVAEMNPHYDMGDYNFPQIKPKPWTKLFPRADPQLLDLLNALLVYSPHRRFSAAQALAHPYFDELRQQPVYKSIHAKYRLADLFNFTASQLNVIERHLQRLQPIWSVNRNLVPH